MESKGILLWMKGGSLGLLKPEAWPLLFLWHINGLKHLNTYQWKCWSCIGSLKTSKYQSNGFLSKPYFKIQLQNTYLVNGLIKLWENKEESKRVGLTSQHLKNYRIEGKKTMGFELTEQMNWTLPDAIFYPTEGLICKAVCRIKRTHHDSIES